jgi:hypothetical protein
LIAPKTLPFSRRLNRIGIGIKVDRRQHGVDKGAESSPAWPLEVSTLHDFDPDIRTKARGADRTQVHDIHLSKGQKAKERGPGRPMGTWPQVP